MKLGSSLMVNCNLNLSYGNLNNIFVTSSLKSYFRVVERDSSEVWFLVRFYVSL